VPFERLALVVVNALMPDAAPGGSQGWQRRLVIHRTEDGRHEQVLPDGRVIHGRAPPPMAVITNHHDDCGRERARRAKADAAANKAGAPHR
jgi:hypothetical protein